MLSKNNKRKTNQVHIISVEQLVPKNYILRKIDKYIDFNFIYELVEDKYSLDNGRPSIDPVVLIKILFIEYLFNIKSMRQTIKGIEVNIAYRRFLGLDFYDKVPHFTTFSQNYRRRFKDKNIFEEIFQNILSQAMNKGFVDEKIQFVDSTHVKVHANRHKNKKEEIKKVTKAYQEELDKEIEKDRKGHGKKPLKEKNEKEEIKEITVSTKAPKRKPKIENPYYKREFIYDEYYDCYLSPENQILEYTTTNIEGYREYKSNKELCKKSPNLKRCTQSKNHQKVVTRHLWQKYLDETEEYRYTKKEKEEKKQ